MCYKESKRSTYWIIRIHWLIWESLISMLPRFGHRIDTGDWRDWFAFETVGGDRLQTGLGREPSHVGDADCTKRINETFNEFQQKLSRERRVESKEAVCKVSVLFEIEFTMVSHHPRVQTAMRILKTLFSESTLNPLCCWNCRGKVSLEFLLSHNFRN